MDVAATLAEHAARVDRFLDTALPGEEEPPAALHAAMRHLIFPGGKRLRPALAFAACESLGRPAEDALPAAAAVELVHIYSLVHDDLPCMDDDTTRRGRPTVHVAFGEAVAVLAGDALLAEAFAVLARPWPSLDPQQQRACLAELAEAAGSRQLVGGQVDDLAFLANDAAANEAAQVESVHRRKTAALIAAAVVCGARCAGARDAQLAPLRRFATAIGTVFQIADDLIDRDAEEPCSLVRVLGEQAARERAASLLRQGLAEIEDWGEPAEPLRELARFSLSRER